MIAAVGADRGAAVAAGQSGADRDTVLEAVYRERYPELVGLARLLIDEHAQAEEIVQEAFARTYEAWSRIRERDDPLAYVRRSIVNLARGGIRRRMVARRARLSPMADAPSAEAGVLDDEQRRLIVAAVLALPRRQRECVVLRYYADCSTSETADALAISDGSVKQHLHRAMHALAAALGDAP